MSSRVEEATEITPLTKLNDNADDDLVVAAGVKLPAMFQTIFRRWVMLTIFCIVNSVASGPMTMFPVLEPILIKEKVFEGPSQINQLSTVYSISMGVVMVSMLPIGIVYDSYGPRWISVVGTILFIIFCIGVGFSIRFRSLNWMLYFSYPICILFGQSTSFGAYGYQWLLPESQNTVNSLIAATQSLSDSLVLACVWLYKDYDVQLWTYFWWLAIFSVGTAIINNIIVPSRREHIGYAAAVTALLESRVPGYGSGAKSKLDPEQSDEAVPIKSSGWRSWDNTKAVFTTFRNFPVENALFTFGCCALYMFTWYPLMQMYPFYVGLFGATEATNLVNTFSVIYGCLGALVTIMSGRVLDCIGLKKSLIIANALNLVALVFLLTPTVPAQLAFQVVIVIGGSLFGVFINRFCMLYAPVQLFGTYSGVFAVILGVFQMTCSAVATLLRSKVAGISAARQARVDIWFVWGASTGFGVLSVLLFGGLLLYWEWFPPPPVGSVTCHDAGIPDEAEYESLEGSTAENGDEWF